MTLSLAANANTNEKIDLVGTIFYSNQLKSFSVIYLKDEKTFSYFIKIKNKNEFQKMKSLIGKSIRVEGDLNCKNSKNEFFFLKEELSLIKISIFELQM